MSISIAQSNPSSYANSSSSKHRQAQNQFEGMPPMPFQAFDMKGKTHFLPEYKGKVVVIAFWAVGDEVSRQQIKSLNRLKQEFTSDQVEIISLAEEDKPDLVSFLKKNKVDYPVIPNSKPLGEMGYGGEFGTSRIFIVDKNSVVKKVIVNQNEKEFETYNVVQPVIKKLLD